MRTVALLLEAGADPCLRNKVGPDTPSSQERSTGEHQAVEPCVPSRWGQPMFLRRIQGIANTKKKKKKSPKLHASFPYLTVNLLVF